MDKLNKIQGSLMGVMIGDAMGMPVEMMTYEKILEITNGVGVTGFMDPVQRKITGTMKLKAGDTTDDWQLTKAVADSLIRRGNFDLVDIALAHVEAYETSVSGWGSTTKSGMVELKEYFDTRGRSGRSPEISAKSQPGVLRGLGNGVAMKVAPLGITRDIIYTNLNTAINKLGKLTHSDIRASSAAYAVAEIIAENVIYDDSVSLKMIIESVENFEDDYDHSEEVLTDKFSDRLSVLLDDDLLYGPIDKLRTVVGTGCLALESVCFAIAVYYRNLNNFKVGILETVNSGGDTDSVASMAGAMIGSNVGLEGIPMEWMAFSSNFNQALEIGDNLYKMGEL